MKVTSEDIAKKCGVSRTTVYRALNNKPRIDPETKSRILKVAKEMGYRPHLLASSLVKERTMTIGVVTLDIRNHYFAQLVSSIETQARKLGYSINITLQQSNRELEMRHINNLVDRRVDGLIICPVNEGDAFNKFLLGLPIPVITTGNKVSNDIPFIGIDEYNASRVATQMIISKDYQRIIFVCPPLADKGINNMHTHQQRLDGFIDAIKTNNYIEYGIIDHSNYSNCINDILKNTNCKTAFFCSGDIFALDVMNYITKLGKSIPHDVGIMGFDGIDILNYITPKLTTVYNPVEEIGIRATQNLINLINGKDIEKHILMDYDIIEGNSL